MGMLDPGVARAVFVIGCSINTNMLVWLSIIVTYSLALYVYICVYIYIVLHVDTLYVHIHARKGKIETQQNEAAYFFLKKTALALGSLFLFVC